MKKRGIVMPRKAMVEAMRSPEPVLVDGADDAEADADQRRQQVAGGGDRQRAPEALVEQVVDRLVVDEGRAEIAAQHHAADPAKILLVEAAC